MWILVCSPEADPGCLSLGDDLKSSRKRRAPPSLLRPRADTLWHPAELLFQTVSNATTYVTGEYSISSSQQALRRCCTQHPVCQPSKNWARSRSVTGSGNVRNVSLRGGSPLTFAVPSFTTTLTLSHPLRSIWLLRRKLLKSSSAVSCNSTLRLWAAPAAQAHPQ